MLLLFHFNFVLVILFQISFLFIICFCLAIIFSSHFREKLPLPIFSQTFIFEQTEKNTPKIRKMHPKIERKSTKNLKIRRIDSLSRRSEEIKWDGGINISKILNLNRIWTALEDGDFGKFRVASAIFRNSRKCFQGLRICSPSFLRNKHSFDKPWSCPTNRYSNSRIFASTTH